MDVLFPPMSCGWGVNEAFWRPFRVVLGSLITILTIFLTPWSLFLPIMMRCFLFECMVTKQRFYSPSMCTNPADWFAQIGGMNTTDFRWYLAFPCLTKPFVLFLCFSVFSFYPLYNK